jgi:DNA-binding transcriptional MerR regulator
MKDKRYNMREPAKELGVTRQTIYYWFKKGWVKPKRDYRNFPVFTVADIKKIKEWKNSLNE